MKHALVFTSERGIGKERFEFQMLYGLRPGRWDELVRAGHNMRVYVPYGTHWFPYFYRPLRERKGERLLRTADLHRGMKAGAV